MSTPHGEIQTPFFMPIATKGAVKTLSSADMEKLGATILLSNTYHLYLRPGVEVMGAFKGLHNFMDWKGPILTDSGGYQVFSLAKRRKITEEGAEFASHIDGSKHMLTPELSMQIQQTIGSDISMVLDECAPSSMGLETMNQSVARTTRWAERSKKYFEHNLSSSNNPSAQLFGIVQGGVDDALRVQHAEDLKKIGFDGYAIGGLSVGEPFEDSCRIVSALNPVLPQDKPRYFMGGAKPHEIVEYVKSGVDMLDCVLPSRNARHGLLYRFVHDDITKPDFYETIHVTNAQYATDPTPLCHLERSESDERSRKIRLDQNEPDSSAPSDFAQDDNKNDVGRELSRYSLAYIHHLFSVEEMLAYRLMTLANIKFYLDLMQKIREAIERGIL